MAKNDIKDDETYRVVLAKSILVGRTTIPPGPKVLLRGDILKGVQQSDQDAVVSFEVYVVTR